MGTIEIERGYRMKKEWREWMTSADDYIYPPTQTLQETRTWIRFFHMGNIRHIELNMVDLLPHRSNSSLSNFQFHPPHRHLYNEISRLVRNKRFLSSFYILSTTGQSIS